MELSKFLRIVLKVDSATCLATAAIVLPAATALEPALGIDAVLLRSAAAPLIPIGLFILWLATCRQTSAALVWLVILGNLGWTFASLIAAIGLEAATPLGRTLVAGQAMAVLAITFAEWIGLRSSISRRAQA